MPKYNVYGIVGASVLLGTYEAGTPEEADKMAAQDEDANWNPGLCHHCSNEVELGDVYETQVEEG